MFASSSGSRAKRRGIVLVVVLGMLGLMALIGVTFATFAGQSLIASRNFGQGVGRPQAEALMDYALAQLINDTNNPVSAIRGHSLLRDMYGNDSVFRGANPTANPVAETGGLLGSINTNGTPVNLVFTAVQPRIVSTVSPSPTPFYNQLQYQTNIPTTGQYYGLDFTRWIIRFAYGNVPQTFEILEDDSTSSPSNVHLFTLSGNLINPTYDKSYSTPPLTSGDWNSFIYFDPNNGVNASTGNLVAYQDRTKINPPYDYTNKPYTILSKEPNAQFGLSNVNVPFVLDGRYMRAFNGPGLTSPDTSGNGVYPYNNAAYANFRIINQVSGHDPDHYGMDEDYDACDLENWFLAIQSADGQVVIPSFHRPGILMATDWTVSVTQSTVAKTLTSAAQRSKILRPRQTDNSPLFPTDPVPDQTTGVIPYDIDNDGDGITDSVWLDLGYPVQRDPGGKLYKPLFAFMVLGTNGRLPLNTVGNLHARAVGDQLNTSGGGESSSLGAPMNTNFASTTQVPHPGPVAPAVAPDNSYFLPNALGTGTQSTSQTYLDAPLWDHASHLGYSVNEINPKFALQNAPTNLYPANNQNIYGGYTLYNSATGTFYESTNYGNIQTYYSQYDNAGVSVALTQMRNILAGTIPTDIQNPVSTSNLNPNSGAVNFSSFTTTPTNSDANVVVVNGQPYVMPNNVADYSDNVTNNGTTVTRLSQAVAGRWGEPQGINQLLNFPSASPVYGTLLAYPPYWYQNQARAGRSIYTGLPIDSMDDDFDSIDPPLPFAYNNPQSPAFNYNNYNGNLPTFYYNSPPAISAQMQVAIGRYYPEQYDLYDPAGQMAVAAERMRRYVTPADPSGVGRLVGFMTRPRHEYDFGHGHDNMGRASYFRYYRPAGMPQEVRYPYGGYGYTAATATAPGTFSGSTYSNGAYSPYSPGSISEAINGHRFLMPQLYPVGQLSVTSAVGTNAARPDVHNNQLHGFQSMLTPEIGSSGTPTAQTIASMGAMPYDWNPLTTTTPVEATTPSTVVGDVPQGYASKASLYSPMINPFNTYNQQGNGITNASSLATSVNISNGPNLGSIGNPASLGTYPIPYAYYPPGPPVSNQPYSTGVPGSGAQVVNGYVGGSLNKDEADEMNLYAPNRYDTPYGPSDLEWLYRLQDVDGATLNSRLSKLAPISFMNPADGLTRRRLFSTDSWELNSFVYANDNPIPYAGILGNPMYLNGVLYNSNGNASTDHDFTYNSRFTPIANSNLEGMNQVVSASLTNPYGNWITTEFLPNPTLPIQSVNFNNGNGFAVGNTLGEYYPNSGYIGASGNNPIVLPRQLDPTKNNTTQNNPPLALLNQFTTNSFTNASLLSNGSGVIQAVGAASSVQVQTPSLSHRDRKINLNHPVPISNDPAEPIRQKWVRETYQMLKAILPPASVDTPEELAALSQYVVNILDFRDPDCTCTRFVNTDLEVTDALASGLDPTNPNIGTATAPVLNPQWDVSTTGVRFAQNPDLKGHFPYDPSIYSPDTTTQFLVQHGMEYSPISINEVMAYQTEYYDTNPPGKQANNRRLFVELVNTLTDDLNSGNSDISLNGWDMLVTPDSFGWGRPDPITGEPSPVAWPPLNPGVSAPTPPNPNPPVTTGILPPAWSSPNPLLLKAGDNQRQPYAIQNNNNTPNMISQLGYVGWAALPNVSVPAIDSKTGAQENYFTLANINNPLPLNSLNVNGDGSSSIDAESSPIQYSTTAMGSVNARIPDTIMPTPTAMLSGTPKNETLPPGKGNAQMFWIYLRRPANPFDNTALTPERPNREMVVVDSARFLFTEGGGVLGSTPAGSSTGNNKLFSIQRLQPNRGGHLVPTDTPVFVLPPGAATSEIGNTAPTINNGTIFQQRPASAYGYSEQTVPVTTAPTSGNYPLCWGTSAGSFPAMKTTSKTGLTPKAMGQAFTYNLDRAATVKDTNWSHVPFHDRDFSSVAELLLVPGCPPGLFTKQFVEESYPGNTGAITYNTTLGGGGGGGSTVTATIAYPTGFDDRANTTGAATGAGLYLKPTMVTAPVAPNMGRVDFPNQYANVYVVPASGSGPSTTPAGPLPPVMTFPYLPDSFYYSAASVAPPSSADKNFTSLPTEIGGWTGAGWYKMFEFFDVPSSASGAIGTADQGNNYDWYRADVKPGLLNLNLIIDEEVFAGLIDDPRLNESLAFNSATSTIPFVVTQVGSTGYPDYSSSTGFIFGQVPIFSAYTTNPANQPATNGATTTLQVGRGYVVRDANGGTYGDYLIPPTNSANPFPYQQVHGLKAAFSDFLKLRHGGSGYLFASGGGAAGSGSFLGTQFSLPVTQTLTPVAAERPFRSLSYPDINYTIMRPASLPPSVFTFNGTVYSTPVFAPPATYTATTPLAYSALGGTSTTNPTGISNLLNLFTYQTSTNYPFIQLNPATAPMNTNWPAVAKNGYQYIGDQGFKNPYASIQYINQNSPTNPPTTGATPTPGTLNLAPPYPSPTPSGSLSQAPFPPPIPQVPPRRLIQVPDHDIASPSGLQGQYNPSSYLNPAATGAGALSDLVAQGLQPFTMNQPTVDLSLSQMNDEPTVSSGAAPPYAIISPPSLVDSLRFVFAPDNYYPLNALPTPSGAVGRADNYLGKGAGGFVPTGVPLKDYRQHPMYRTEWLQKIMNLTTVRTHQFAVWITVGFFEVVKTGTPELGIPDVLGQELGLAAGKNTRYRSFFTLDRTKATGFNPYYPGNFRDCVTYRRRIE